KKFVNCNTRKEELTSFSLLHLLKMSFFTIYAKQRRSTGRKSMRFIWTNILAWIATPHRILRHFYKIDSLTTFRSTIFTESMGMLPVSKTKSKDILLFSEKTPWTSSVWELEKTAI